MSKQTH